MDLTLLIMAFGGGAFGAAVGGVPAFVFTGLTVLAAVFGGAAGAPIVGAMSFGSFFGPHVAFGGAVAGATYAKSKGLLENGQDIVTPLFGTGDAGVLLVGGIFGVMGYVLHYLIADVIGGMVIGNAGWTDTVALTVFISAIIARFVFTKSGLTGTYTGSEKRVYFPSGKRLSFLIMVGIAIGVVIGGLAATLGQMAVAGDEYALALFNSVGVIGFGIAAALLIFACMGLPLEGHHHIILPAGTTAMLVFANSQNPIAAIVGGAVMGVITALWGEVMGLTFNSYADSHIDPPAATIWVWQLVNFMILASVLPSTM